jgi:hypothetical protein
MSVTAAFIAVQVKNGQAYRINNFCLPNPDLSFRPRHKSGPFFSTESIEEYGPDSQNS